MFSSYAKVAQLVEHDPSKVGVASSNLVFRSKFLIMGTGAIVILTSIAWIMMWWLAGGMINRRGYHRGYFNGWNDNKHSKDYNKEFKK